MLLLVVILTSHTFLHSQVWLKYKNMSAFTTAQHFPFQRWQHWKTRGSWWPLQWKPNTNIQGTARLIYEEYKTQVSAEIEGRITKKMSQDFGRTESRILVALSKLDEFLLKTQVRTQSGTVPGASRNTDLENQEPNGDCSQNHPRAEVGSSVYRFHYLIDSDSDETPYRIGVFFGENGDHPMFIVKDR